MRPILPFSLSRPLIVVSDIDESMSSLISARISDADFCRLPLLIADIFWRFFDMSLLAARSFSVSILSSFPISSYGLMN